MTDVDPRNMTRRQLMRHSAWFGAAVGLAVVGGEVLSHVPAPPRMPSTRPGLRFAQISDSHLGFNGTANPDVVGSFGRAITQINNLGYTPPISSSTPETSRIWPHRRSSIR